MKELLRTNDMVFISFLETRLREAGIEPILLDLHTSIIEGSIGALPRRLMIADEEYEQARAVQRAAEAEVREGHEGGC